jgi:hypothetical protein
MQSTHYTLKHHLVCYVQQYDTLNTYVNCNGNHSQLGCETVYFGKWKQQVPPQCWKFIVTSVMKTRGQSFIQHLPVYPLPIR